MSSPLVSLAEPAALPRSVSDFAHALLLARRALAYLRVDESLVLVEAGGELGHYGLDRLQLGQPACEQAYFLAGLLPPEESLQPMHAMQMENGRVADLHFHVDRHGTWIVLVDVTDEHDDAQRVQQKAYDMTLLSEREAQLIQRLEAANAALLRTQRELEQSREALLRTNRRLEQELTDAANYVRSILPAPLTEPFVVDWRYVPSTELGGDSFGYHWLDADHFAFYLLDVCGHGVGSALLSVAVSNALRSKVLPGIDFRAPGAVLSALNDAFLMENHNDLYFTIWYGVFEPRTRRVKFASAGHPPALLVHAAAAGPEARAQVEELRGAGPLLGMFAGSVYRHREHTVPPRSRLFVLSDGAYEIQRPDGSMLDFDEFVGVLAQQETAAQTDLERIWAFVRELHGEGPLDDDFSLVEFKF